MSGFRRSAFFDDESLVGARWWQETLAAHADPVTRRHALRNILFLVGGVAATGIVINWIVDASSSSSSSSSSSGPPILRDALELQKEKGWDVGGAGDELAFPSSALNDVDGKFLSRESLGDLASLFSPAETRLQPYYVPTLFQATTAPSSQSLRDKLTFVHNDDMDAAFARGTALADLLAGKDAPAGTAVLVDAPGPIAVAVAAGMAERLAPVFLFDNWPHPDGVVPSHLTLAAALYYLPRFKAASAKRPADALPVFVGDAARLSSYSDEQNKFDNRYLLKLPSGPSLSGLGVRHILMVRPTGNDKELDDLNDDVVALDKAGISVKVVGLDDFKSAAAATNEPDNRRHYYWGGSSFYHPYFWPTYGWGRTVVYTAPAEIAPYSRGASYAPVTRPTLFSSRAIGGTSGIGRTRPTGFGVVSYRAGESIRSGSWGRASSSGGG